MDKMVVTQKGIIQGIERERDYAFLGIPYAKPPVGALRFRAPQPVEPWSGVWAADRFANRSIQRENHAGDFYGKEFFSNRAYIPPMSEDCLYLNVWTPKQAQAPYPVAIWYHGGGFEGGHGSEPEFDGEAFAKRGIILVTINYRLGLLGWLCHRDLREDGRSGNYGLLDQIAALDWVRENIAAFGGDPGCITLFGQSAGGMAVRDLMCCPQVQGKIHRAAMQSCNGYKGALRVDFSMEMMEKITEKYLQKKKLSLETLLSMPAMELVQLQKDYNAFAGFKTKAGLSLTPVVDGAVLPEFPDKAVERGNTARIPYLTGATKDDLGSAPFGKKSLRRNKTQMSLMRWSGMHTAQNCNSYSYYFAHDLPGDKAGAFHSSELWYVFGTWKRCWRPMGAQDEALSEQMTDAWASFIRIGDPGWEPCTGENGPYRMFQ